MFLNFVPKCHVYKEDHSVWLSEMDIKLWHLTLMCRMILLINSLPAAWQIVYIRPAIFRHSKNASPWKIRPRNVHQHKYKFNATLTVLKVFRVYFPLSDFDYLLFIFVLHPQCLFYNWPMLNPDHANDLIWTWRVLTCTDMRVQKWLWTVEWCWESACGTSLWHGRCSSLKTSTASSVTWSSRPLTSPQMLSPHSRYTAVFSFCFQHLHTISSSNIFLPLPLRIS